jgi:hypothetical protein
MTTKRTSTVRYLVGGLVAILVMFGSGLTGAVYASHQFPDVGGNNPFHGDIDWLVDQKVASGYNDGKFHPTDPVTRQELAAMLHRYAGRTETAVTAVNFINKTAVELSVPCPAGKVAVGGGGLLAAGTDMYLTGSHPYGPGLDRGWAVEFESDNNVIRSGTIWAMVSCLPEG